MCGFCSTCPCLLKQHLWRSCDPCHWMPRISRLDILKVFSVYLEQLRQKCGFGAEVIAWVSLFTVRGRQTMLKGLSLFRGPGSPFKVKAESREMLLVSTGLVELESPKIQKSKFLGMLLTAVGLPSNGTESLHWCLL